MKEACLADVVPLWRTLRECEVTALVTPALDYVGGLELGSVDLRFASPEPIASLGEGLRSFVAALDDECTLHFVYSVSDRADADIRDYEALTADAHPAALRQYVAARARWLRQQCLRRTTIFLFFSGPGAKTALSRGYIGAPLLYASLNRLSLEAHQERLRQLAQLRDRIVSRLQQLRIPSRELSPDDIIRLHFQLLNPTRAQAQAAPPQVALRDTLFSPATVRREGAHLAELTEAEQLVYEDLEDHRGHFRQGHLFRRALTLKILPELGTDYFAAEPLFALADGNKRPVPFTLTATVHIQHQGRAQWTLNTQHGLVDALQRAIPFLANSSIAKQSSDIAKQHSIAELFAELNAMSTKLVTLSVSILLEAVSLAELDDRTEAAKAAFTAIGNSQLLVEDVAQVPAFLSMLPGAGPYQLRKKGCTSRNAGDFLPVFAPWRGCSRASSLLLTPTQDAFRLDLFDKSLTPAHHGLVIADTGSGKSVSLGALTLDALAAGADAILVDNGGSWRPLTELMGGTHIPVNLRTSLSPFVPFPQILDAAGTPDPEALHDVVTFLEVCVTERGQSGTVGFDKLEIDVVSRAVRRTYEHLRDRPDERPLISHFRDALVEYPYEHPDDRSIADRVAQRLRIYCDGLYADFLNRPSSLRFDARLLTFDLADVAKNPTSKEIAMATIIQAITSRAAARRAAARLTPTLVEVDEGHEHLGADDVGSRFLAGAYRKMRKFGVAMWMISQQFRDFVNAKAGPTIVDNSHIKIFLRHGGGHDQITSYFGLSARAAAAFKSLDMRPGHYSDFLLLYGQKVTTVRLALAPLAYWILTTDSSDRRLLDSAIAKNPGLDRLSLLEQLAARYPHGAPRPGGA